MIARSASRSLPRAHATLFGSTRMLGLPGSEDLDGLDLIKCGAQEHGPARHRGIWPEAVAPMEAADHERPWHGAEAMLQAE